MTGIAMRDVVSGDQRPSFPNSMVYFFIYSGIIMFSGYFPLADRRTS